MHAYKQSRDYASLGLPNMFLIPLYLRQLLLHKTCIVCIVYIKLVQYVLCTELAIIV